MVSKHLFVGQVWKLVSLCETGHLLGYSATKPWHWSVKNADVQLRHESAHHVYRDTYEYINTHIIHIYYFLSNVKGPIKACWISRLTRQQSAQANENIDGVRRQMELLGTGLRRERYGNSLVMLEQTVASCLKLRDVIFRFMRKLQTKWRSRERSPGFILFLLFQNSLQTNKGIK